MPQIIYEIKDWDEHFESSHSRKIKGPLKWGRVTTRHDSRKFRRLTNYPNSLELFGAWNVIWQVAAKMPVRGRLVDSDGQPLTADDIEDMTGFPACGIQEALDVLTSPRIGWITASKKKTANSRKTVSKQEDVASLPAFPEDDPIRCKAIKAIERLMGRGLSAGQIDQVDKWAMSLPDSIEINSEQVGKWQVIDLAAGSAMSAQANIRGAGGAMKYLGAVIDRCIRESLPPGKFEQTTRTTKPRKSAAKADADDNLTPTEVQI